MNKLTEHFLMALSYVVIIPGIVYVALDDTSTLQLKAAGITMLSLLFIAIVFLHYGIIKDKDDNGK